MVAPDAFVADIHALFALTCRFDDRTIHLDGRLLEERVVLPLPCLQANFVESILQTVYILNLKSPTEVTSGGWVGDALGSDGVEKELIVTSCLDILQAGSAAQPVVGKIENVIGFVLGEMLFEQMQCIVDPIWQADLHSECMNGSQAAVGGPPCFLGQFIPHVVSGNHRLTPITTR